MVKCIKAVEGKCKQRCSASEAHVPETMSDNKDCTWPHYCDDAKTFVKCVPVITDRS